MGAGIRRFDDTHAKADEKVRRNRTTANETPSGRADPGVADDRIARQTEPGSVLPRSAGADRLLPLVHRAPVTAPERHILTAAGLLVRTEGIAEGFHCPTSTTWPPATPPP